MTSIQYGPRLGGTLTTSSCYRRCTPHFGRGERAFVQAYRQVPVRRITANFDTCGAPRVIQALQLLIKGLITIQLGVRCDPRLMTYQLHSVTT